MLRHYLWKTERLNPATLWSVDNITGRVKAMFNERNKKMDGAGPSAPAVILGLNGAPQAGEKFKVYEEEAEAKEIANRRAQILREQGMRPRNTSHLMKLVAVLHWVILKN
jgi:translation initiation factor IF-2